MGSRHYCLFVGAGYSKALFGLPIQNHFIDALLLWARAHTKHPHVSEDLEQLLKEFGDIELVLSFYQFRAEPPKRARNRRLVRELMFFRVAIAQYLNEHTKTHSYETCYRQLLEEFVRSRRIDRTNLVIVTTNFDLCIERMLEDLFGLDSYYYPGLKSVSTDDRIPLLKLHGSVNWLENRGPATAKDYTRNGRPPELRDFASLASTPSPNDQWGYFWTDGRDKYTPLLMPFMYQKDVFSATNPVFDEVKKETSAALHEAKHLMFWGYGLPSADYYMLSLLYESLHESAATCEVVDLGCPVNTNLSKLCRLIFSKTDRLAIYGEGLESYLESQRDDRWQLASSRTVGHLGQKRNGL